MIISRRHLEEFISLTGLSDQEIADAFVSIGHEVASITSYTFHKQIVVGKVVSCEKHPEADKLSVCEVLVGDSKLQIVCGASNVAKDQFVPVALVGTTMPDGLVIKDAELRGVKSSGMICSAKELGLPELNDGILPLDNSIGDLIVGKPLKDYPLLNDTVFELELTANRGDAFSVYGIARDLAAKLETTARKTSLTAQNNTIKGVGRVLQLTTTSGITSSVVLRVFENSHMALELLTNIRAAISGIKKPSAIDTICGYITHSTGVLFRAFDLEGFDKTDDDRYLVKIVNEDGVDLLVGKEMLMSIGIDSNSKYFAKDDSKQILLVAYHANMDIVSKAVWKNRLKTDDLHTKSAKGSECDLEFGVSYFSNYLSDKTFYSESLSFVAEKEEIKIVANIDEIYSIIGQNIDKNRVVQVLKRVGVSLQASADDNNFVITPPAHRPDLLNIADISEEVVRILGINSIESKPLVSGEIRAVNSELDNFLLERELARKAASNGFFESLSFLFCNKELLELFGYQPLSSEVDVANPITSDLDTLRPTLLLGLLENAQRNSAKSRDTIALFEIGDVIDSSREQSREIAFVFSGKKELPSVANHAKPQEIDLIDFARKIAGVIGGNVSLDLIDSPKYLQDGQSGAIVVGSKRVGVLGKLHPKVAKHYDLATTFVAQIDLAKLPRAVKQAMQVSKLQRVYRDITVLVSQSVQFKAIKSSVMELDNPLIEEIRAIDLFKDASLGDRVSLTMRISILPFEKSLKDDEINGVVSSVLEHLKSTFGVEQR